MSDELHSLTENEYVRRMATLHAYVMSLRKDSDYVINQPQMDKLVELVDFFLKLMKKVSGELQPLSLVPSAEHGGVTAHFWYFSVSGDEIQDFASVIRHCSALSIDCLDTGEVCISCTIPNVFIPKKS